MYQEGNVTIDVNDYDENYLLYFVMCGEVKIEFIGSLKGNLDEFKINGADIYLDAKDDIKFAYNGEFQTVDFIYNDTIDKAIRLHEYITREIETECRLWDRHCASFSGGKL